MSTTIRLFGPVLAVVATGVLVTASLGNYPCDYACRLLSPDQGYQIKWDGTGWNYKTECLKVGYWATGQLFDGWSGTVQGRKQDGECMTLCERLPAEADCASQGDITPAICQKSCFNY